MNCLLFTLGSPNDEHGNLSNIALDRLNCTLNIYKYNAHINIICTGGRGEHFNKTSFPHALYAQRYLLSKGVQKKHLPAIIESSNTIEDITLAKPVIETYKPDLVMIITSDFHMERVKFICDKINWFSNCIFISAVSTLPAHELETLMARERSAIIKLQQAQSQQ